jgi:hypothetical protein
MSFVEFEGIMINVNNINYFRISNSYSSCLEIFFNKLLGVVYKRSFNKLLGVVYKRSFNNNSSVLLGETFTGKRCGQLYNELSEKINALTNKENKEKEEIK